MYSLTYTYAYLHLHTCSISILQAKPFEGEAKIAKVVTLHMFSEADTTAWVKVINGSGPIPDKLKKDEVRCTRGVNERKGRE
jgi:hypothetical protein